MIRVPAKMDRGISAQLGDRLLIFARTYPEGLFKGPAEVEGIIIAHIRSDLLYCKIIVIHKLLSYPHPVIANVPGGGCVFYLIKDLGKV